MPKKEGKAKWETEYEYLKKQNIDSMLNKLNKNISTNKEKPKQNAKIDEINTKIDQIRRNQAKLKSGSKEYGEEKMKLKQALADKKSLEKESSEKFEKDLGLLTEEKRKLENFKENKDKIERVLEYRKKQEDRKEKLEKEQTQYNKNLILLDKKNAMEEKIEEERKEIASKREKIVEKLKAKGLKEEEINKLKEELAKVNEKESKNNQKYSKNKNEIKILEEKVKTKVENKEDILKTNETISKCNMICKNLMEGKSWEQITEKLENWEDRTNPSKKPSAEFVKRETQFYASILGIKYNQKEQTETEKLAEEQAKAEQDLAKRIANKREEPEIDEALAFAKQKKQELEDRLAAEQQAAPEQVAPEQVVPEQVVPEQVAPEQVVPEQVAPEQVAPEQVVPEQVVPEQVAPEQVVPEQVVPEQVAPEQVAAEQEVEEEKIPNITNIYISGNTLAYKTNLSEEIQYADNTDYKGIIYDTIIDSALPEEDKKDLLDNYIKKLIERNKGNNSFAKIFSILSKNKMQFFEYLDFITCVPEIKREINIDNLPKIRYIFNDKTNKMKFKQKIELYDEYFNMKSFFKNEDFEDRKLDIKSDLGKTQEFFLSNAWALKSIIQDIKDRINTRRLERGGDKEVIEAIQNDREEQEAKKEEKPAKPTFRDSLKVLLGKGKEKDKTAKEEQVKKADERSEEEKDPEFIPFDQVEEIGRNLTPSEPPQQESQVDDDEFYTILNDIIKNKDKSTGPNPDKDNPTDGSR